MWEAYEQVDWALDISRCDSADLSIRGLPARLIRRDPAFHAVMSRAQALDGAWRRIDLTSTHFAVTIGMLLEEGWKDVVLTAPRSGKRAASAVEALAALRDLGAAD